MVEIVALLGEGAWDLCYYLLYSTCVLGDAYLRYGKLMSLQTAWV